MPDAFGFDCKTRYPILLIHGVGFRDLKRPLYWGRIPVRLTECGAELYYGLTDSWGRMEDNVRLLERRVDEILIATGAKKVNLIGHSKGGLEARLLASKSGAAKRIASVTTIASPHRGSATMDRLLKLPKPLFALAAFAVNNWIRLIGDKTPDFQAVCRELGTDYMLAFDREMVAEAGIYCQSVACVMRDPTSDVNLSTAQYIIRQIEGENDGLVSLDSAIWGERCLILRGVGRRGVSHLDAIDLRRRPLTRKREPQRVSDICELYVELLKGLRERGL